MLNTIILKIVSPCNLNCTYCYEYNRGDDSWKYKPKAISEEIAVCVGHRIKEYCEYNKLTVFNVNFHGGEPLMLTAVKLEKIILAITSSAKPIRIRFGVQTNGTLMTKRKLETLSKYNVAVGVSVDGGEIHNRLRVDHNGLPTFTKVQQGIRILKEKQRLFSGLLCVVDLNNNPEDVLDELMKFSPPNIDLLPPFANYDNPPQEKYRKNQLGDWLIRAFIHWTSSVELQKVKIRYLEDALTSIVSGESRSDWFGLKPPGYVVIATDGNYEGLDTLKVVEGPGRITGMNVANRPISAVLKSEAMIIRMKGIDGLSEPCKRCSIVQWCGGGYLPTRYQRNNGFDNPSFYCSDLKMLFKHIGGWVLRSKEIDENLRFVITQKIKNLE